MNVNPVYTIPHDVTLDKFCFLSYRFPYFTKRKTRNFCVVVYTWGSLLLQEGACIVFITSYWISLFQDILLILIMKLKRIKLALDHYVLTRFSSDSSNWLLLLKVIIQAENVSC